MAEKHRMISGSQPLLEPQLLRTPAGVKSKAARVAEIASGMAMAKIIKNRKNT